MLPSSSMVQSALPVVSAFEASNKNFFAPPVVGLLIVKLNEEEVPPPGAGVTTVTAAVHAVAMFAEGTLAESCVLLVNVVVSAVPFQFTTEPLIKLLPVTLSVNVAPPAVAEEGEIEESDGTGLLIE